MSFRSLKFIFRGCRGARRRWPNTRPRVTIGLDLAQPAGERIAVVTIDNGGGIIRPANRYEVLCGRDL